MKKYLTGVAGLLAATVLFAQGGSTVPKAVKNAFVQKYPDAKQVTWEKEKGNYEANWGGKSGEANSALFTSTGTFLEIAKAIPVNQLPARALNYIKTHYKNASVSEAALVTDAKGKVSYEGEVAHQDLVFDEHGNFLKAEKE